MEKNKEMIAEKRIMGISDYVNLSRDIEKEIEKGKKESGKTIKIAILSSFTIKGLKETLLVKCCESGILPEFYVGDYNQYSQEILDENSRLYQFDPDLIIIFIDTMTILGDHYFLPYRISEEERRNWLDETYREITSLIQKIKERSSAKILLHNFEVPIFSPLGIVENKENFGFIESIQAFNAFLRNGFKDDNQVFIFDYDSFCSKIGKRNIMNYKMYYLGDIKLDFQYIPELCNEYLSYIKPQMSIIKKCIVLDLDNTLWGGIIGEDGLEGIKLGPSPEGRPFWEFQKYLLSLFNRGVLLAIDSKNNLDDALKVFREHPHMILRENHFAAMKINWDDKISNMMAIAEELNIGVDSFVFFDDDKLNRIMVKDALPEVLVVDTPDDPALCLKTLMEINDFNIFRITEEDKKKGQMYAEQRKRKELEHTSKDIKDYLRSLETVVTIEKPNSFNIPRIAQLTQKTNQFNMTTRRYLEEDIMEFLKNGNYLVVSAGVEDKFGDNGITGLIIAEKSRNNWRIDTLLMSCRVIARGVEEVLLAYLIEEAKKENAVRFMGEFIPTEKNIPSKEFYKKNGFEFVKKDGALEIWEYDLKKEYKYPDYLRIIKS